MTHWHLTSRGDLREDRAFANHDEAIQAFHDLWDLDVNEGSTVETIGPGFAAVSHFPGAQDTTFCVTRCALSSCVVDGREPVSA